jgi:hypothetical protein
MKLLFFLLASLLVCSAEKIGSGDGIHKGDMVSGEIHQRIKMVSDRIMFGKIPVVMRPISETTWQSPCSIRVWFTISL